MFKLGVATSAIVVFVALLQASVGLQIYRLGEVQSSINTTSVPLLQKTQKLARITSETLSQTALLEGALPAAELLRLETDYRANQNAAEQILWTMSLDTAQPEIATRFQDSREQFESVNGQLFRNQFEQRAQEAAIEDRTQAFKIELNRLGDLVDRMLITSTTQILNPLEGAEDGRPITEDDLAKYRAFAAEVEILNSLKTNKLSMVDSLDHFIPGANASELENDLKFRLRSIGQSLILLRDSPERVSLAQISSELNAQLGAADGLIAFLRANAITRARFQELRNTQRDAVERINTTTDQLVSSASRDFRLAIGAATSITSTILWIGVATTFLVLFGIVLINWHVIRRQISKRFTTLTEDVLAISNGDYDHKIRVSGADEIGDIAKALDLFKDQAAELQRSNAELEKFAYVAAHDLRSPLDAIQDLARWTLEDEREHMSKTCIENLELLMKRSSRLSALQSDLLTYAKVAKIDTASETFSLRNEVEKLSDLLDPHGKFFITVENDPGEITTFGIPTRQILLNLITNAMKHHDKGEGRIIVDYERGADTHIISIEDDGPGIEPRFQSKVFELFKTLQSRDAVEGSGLGLALVTKLIARIDGKLTVQSNAPKERGCKFTFEIADLSVANDNKGVAA